MDTCYRLRPFLTILVGAPHEPRLFRTLLGSRYASNEPAAITLCLNWERGSRNADRYSTSAVRGRYKGIPWRCSVEKDQSDRWLLRFASPAFRPYLSFHIALLPAIREVLDRQGEALVSGAAFGAAGEAILLLGATGSGKTSTLLAAVERGFTPIADEYFSVSASGAAQGLLQGIGLRHNIRNQAPSVYASLPPSSRLMLMSLRVAQLATLNRFQPLLHLSWPEMGLKPSPPVSWKVRAIWWLEGNRREKLPERLPGEEMARRAAAHLATHDHRYGSPLQVAWPEGESRSLEVLARSFRQTECYAGSPEAALTFCRDMSLPLTAGR